MKQLLLVLLLTPLFQLAGVNLANITKAISNGNADELGRYFDQTVEIAVLDKEDVYSKPQAIAIIKKFFSEYQPKAFSQVHKGESTGKDSQYCIGNLTTNSATFRVYIYMKVNGDNFLIQELRFDKE